MEFKEESAYLEAIEACRKYALLQSNAVNAWIDSGVSVETLANVINTRLYRLCNNPFIRDDRNRRVSY